ncbi:hypothetical protein BWQ96_08134 [Gracilariopsis chorda]|uniref:Uncharacterized protein n=1 Tax=Gracilariopsis chorda TaxID=448386 RepID=A0A2V3IJ83_9FLOR|nr:hypothetical protein BWQ96_08134 [Gracilariopsis chorda]|eukprot:PXF42156.1 hypothetical protein BWQ96_08134 [Gracilariopsis chorda]
MTSTPQQTAIALRRALQNCDSRGLKSIISNLPSALLLSDDPGQIAQCLEHVRVVADVLADACDFNTAFEAAIYARSLLIQAKMLPWAVSVLESFAFDERIASRVALALAHVGIGAEARGEIGKAGAVDQIAIVWKAHPTSIPIVQALISLCTGHIDNISRLMRRRGISTAIKVLRSSQSATNVQLAEQVMILVGLCTICIPDNVKEGSSLVPAILHALNSSGKRKPVAVARHALIAIANMADCWVKERAGYELGDIERLVQLVITSWKSARTCKDMALAATWALSALYSHDTDVQIHVKRRGQEFSDVVSGWKTHSRTAALLTIIFDATKGLGKQSDQFNSEDEKMIITRPQRLNRTRRRRSSVGYDADGSCGDQDAPERSLSRSTKPRKLTVRPNVIADKTPIRFATREERNEEREILNKSPGRRTGARRLAVRKHAINRKLPGRHAARIEQTPEIYDSDSDLDSLHNQAEPHQVMEETSSEVQTIVVDSDSDTVPSCPPRSPECSVPLNDMEAVGQKPRRKRRRITSNGDESAASPQPSEEVVFVKSATNDHLVYGGTDVRRSTRMKKPNSKYIRSPKREGTRRLRGRRPPTTRSSNPPSILPPLVSLPSVVPQHQLFEMIDVKLK